MENILKLNLKKEVFENVKNGVVSELTFETSPFYFSRFTTSKNNTVEDVEKDSTLIKSYTGVTFSCSGESFDCTEPEVTIVNNEFVLNFTNPNYNMVVADPDEELIEEIAEETIDEKMVESVEELVEETVEQKEEPVLVNEPEPVKEIVERQLKDVENLKSTVSEEQTFLNEYFKNSNVYPLSSERGVISFYGNVQGCKKRLPIRNEHDFTFTLNTIEVKSSELKETLNSLLNGGYVFIYKDVDTNSDPITLKYKVLSRLTVVNII